MLGQLRALSAADFAPRERATIAEVLRDQVAYLHKELARRYAGKAQPAVDRELEAADQALTLWQALWEQYSACLKPLLEGDPELSGVKPKLLQRGLYVGKQLVLALRPRTARAVPAALWQELHAYYRLAEMLECAVTSVSDELMGNAVGISCYSTYTHALLLGLADPYAMSVKQIELTDRWLGDVVAQGFPLCAAARDRGPGHRCRSRKPRRRDLVPVGAAPCADVDALRLSRQARHQRARSSEASADRAPTRPSCSLATIAAPNNARRCSGISTRGGTTCRAARASAPQTTVELCGGGLGGGLLPHRRPHVRAQGSRRTPVATRARSICRRWTR